MIQVLWVDKKFIQVTNYPLIGICDINCPLKPIRPSVNIEQ